MDVTRMRADWQTESGAARWLFRLSTRVFLGVLVAVLVVAAAKGPFAYAVDDSYIHLALARNVAFHGTWGLVPGVFQSASSSPGWTVLLAAGLRLWPLSAEWLPLALNVAAALWLLWAITNLVAASSIARFRRGPALAVCAACAVGVVPLVLTGMEHTLHAAIVSQLLVLLHRRSYGDWTTRARRAWYLLLAVGVFVRLETVMVGAAACIAVLVVERLNKDGNRFRFTATGLSLAAPVAVIAAMDLIGGAYPLPNSVTAKSVLTNGSLLDVGRVVSNLHLDPGLVVVGFLCLLTAVHAHRRNQDAMGLGALTVGLTVVGLELFGPIGVFGRYEAFAYLGGMATLGAYLLTGAIDFASDWPRRLTVGVAVIALATPVGLLLSAPTAMSNINSQQAAMGRFMAEYYDGRSVAVNDIGEVAYRHRGELVDFEGLGSFDVLQHRRTGDFNADAISHVLTAHDVKVVAVFEKLYDSVLPPQLIRVGRWCLTEPVLVNGDRCVTWFGTSQPDAAQLRENLRAFGQRLPSTENLELT